uniref:NADH-quinone oxidoreductase subunit F n=1 Tax=Candidatus Kentrum sp. LFY TaxID=2126342 RepID=A0A450W9U8_9GAMM|nr:MAG: iron-hydrogenase subunit beta [Candidatus Kentron sp. LFY]
MVPIRFNPLIHERSLCFQNQGNNLQDSDFSTIDFSGPRTMSRNLSKLSGRQGMENNLFARLGDPAMKGGNASEYSDRLAREFLIGKANIHGAMTFYDLPSPDGQGKKVYVCNGSACLCAGTQPRLIGEMKNHFKDDEIGAMTCLGRCFENSAFQYKGKNYSNRSPEEIARIIESGDSVKSEFPVNALGSERPGNTCPGGSICPGNTPRKDDATTNKVRNEFLGTPVLTTEYGLDTQGALLRETLKRDPKEILQEIKDSGIRGRGGAGYPMGMKWESCRNSQSDSKFILCNADEGDPGAYSDRYLLERRPHLVLFGMIIGGFCIGAKRGILYIRAEYPESVIGMEKAIAELRDDDLIGKNIAGSGFDFEITVIEGQGSYICGEETALIDSIEGQRPEPRTRPPFPTEQGLFQKPTVVNNVETLANVPFIMENGGSAYRKLGTETSTGTKLICVDSYFNRPGIHEVEMGTPLSGIVNELAGGFKGPVKALHIGGPLGGLVPIPLLDRLTLDFESFAEHGFVLGHASMVSIPENFPMMEYLGHLFSFAAHESCGKCFPCRLGTYRGLEMFEKAKAGEYRINGHLLDDLLHTLETGSLCAHGSGIAVPIRSALKYFEGELSRYITDDPSENPM